MRWTSDGRCVAQWAAYAEPDGEPVTIEGAAATPAAGVSWRRLGSARSTLFGALRVAGAEVTAATQHVETAIFVAAGLAESALLPRCAWLRAALHSPEEPRSRLVSLQGRDHSRAAGPKSPTFHVSTRRSPAQLRAAAEQYLVAPERPWAECIVGNAAAVGVAEDDGWAVVGPDLKPLGSA